MQHGRCPGGGVTAHLRRPGDDLKLTGVIISIVSMRFRASAAPEGLGWPGICHSYEEKSRERGPEYGRHNVIDFNVRLINIDNSANSFLSARYLIN